MKVTATPNAPAEYNQFLDGLNTEIERELGKDNIESAFKPSADTAYKKRMTWQRSSANSHMK